MSDPDDTFMKLRIGHLEQRKADLMKIAHEANLSQDLKNFDEFRRANQELLDIHAKMIEIYKDEAAKIDEEIERRK